MALKKGAKVRNPYDHIWAQLRGYPIFCEALYKLVTTNSANDYSEPEEIINKEILFADGVGPVDRKTFRRLFRLELGCVSYVTSATICAHLAVNLTKILQDIKLNYVQEMGALKPNEKYIEQYLFRMATEVLKQGNAQHYKCTPPYKSLPTSFSTTFLASKLGKGRRKLDKAIDQFQRVRNGEVIPRRLENLMTDDEESLEAIFLSLNPLIDPLVRKKFVEFTGSFFERADQLVGWASFLPCSLESPRFMEEHHRHMFKRRIGDAGGSDRIKSMAMEYNLIGHANRERMLAQLDARKTYKFIHILDEKGLKQIQSRKGDYSDFSEELYTEQFDYLTNLVGKHEQKIEIRVSKLEPSFPKEICHDKDKMDSAFVLIEKNICIVAVLRRVSGEMILVCDKKLAKKVHHSLIENTIINVGIAKKILDGFVTPAVNKSASGM